MAILAGLNAFKLASVTLDEAGTGCTVVCCPEGATGAVDVRGGAPATRETDLLRPEETVDKVHAVVLSGGSAFGLAAASGAAEELERRGIGLDMGVCKVPIVSSACLFDLTVGSASVRPGIKEGAAAVAAALDGGDEPLEEGNVGAGTGCSVGKLLGFERSMKSGLGTAVVAAGDLKVGAVVAVNAVGDVLDPMSGQVVAGARMTPDAEAPMGLVELSGAMAQMASAASQTAPRTNTTIACVFSNARLTKPQALRVAQMSADAYAKTIFPSHTSMDGDSIFCLASGEVEADLDMTGILATQALTQAIVSACKHAKTAYGLPGAAN